MFERILLCTDGSRCALRAAHAAAMLAQRFHAQLLVLHVTTAPVLVGGRVSAPPAAPDIVERWLEEAHTGALQATREVLDGCGVDYTVRSESGHVVERILELAQQESADLIVLGSRGWSEMRSMLLGTVSDRVSHHARCTVLIVK